MASMDLSLDDIIKKKFTKNPVKGKGGFKKFVGNNAGNNRPNPQANTNRRQGAVPPQRRLGTQNAYAGAGQQPPRQTIGDARNRIIQKKRMQLTDARDKLCELAKKTDARQKLEKLRERRMGVDNALGPLGYNGFRMNLKRPMRSPVNVAGRAGHGHIALQRTINQPIGSGRFHSKVPALMDMDIDLNDDYIPEAPLQLCRTVNNDQMRAEPLLRPSKLSSSSPYSWKAPQPVPRLTQSSSSRGYIDLDYPAEQRKRMKLPSPPPPPMMRPNFVSDDEDMVEPVRPTVRSSRATSDIPVSGTKSRLESSRIQASSAASGGSSGYRIVVSNLQTTVTHEDIRELFEDVGPLVTSRLVRPGTAEVVYRQFKDAERAVENYHNRQLDGQPMKCLLVKPRPSTASTAQPSSGTLRGPVASSSKLTGSGKSSVVPDISTIHKALFNKA